MAVWLPQELSASRPTMPATLASESKVDASHKVKSISAINDRLVPKDENDRSVPYYHWWPKQELPNGYPTSSHPKRLFPVLPYIGMMMLLGEDAAYRKVGRCTIKMHKASGNR